MQNDSITFTDDMILQHPAYLLGSRDALMFFLDEWDVPFYLTLAPGETPDLFPADTVLDAADLQPVTDPDQLDTVNTLRKRAPHEE